ncbi:dihydrofolate reductase family protein [Niabella aurantiaca]|uniref:dihydrofolate reductase family protein n=1 Tax=Niabella aurantiaca TaxID=379900 RepID=UPI00037F89E0|nr:dihydrofolate reductase family protein [Niabella aurantiaca]
MRKLIIEAEVSIDGIVNSPDIWGEIFRYHSADVTSHLHSLLRNADALILGRKTYEFFAQVWPERDDENAKKINSMPKYIASRNPDLPLKWNAAHIPGTIGEGVQALKQEPGNSLVQYGIGELTKTLLGSGLIDEFQLLVFPFTFGKGERWFDIIGPCDFQLLECKPFSSGTLLLRYQPKYTS